MKKVFTFHCEGRCLGGTVVVIAHRKASAWTMAKKWCEGAHLDAGTLRLESERDLKVGPDLVFTDDGDM